MKQVQTFKFDPKLLNKLKKEAKLSRIPFNRYVENLLSDYNGWIAEYRSARKEVEKLKTELVGASEEIEHYEQLIKQWGSGE